MVRREDMPQILSNAYNREAAVEYAHTWAFSRNPAYYDFKGIGGDCTNFTSQCLYAGAKIMNYTPTFGWYYINLNRRAPAWTSVQYFHQFLLNNKGVGPYGSEASIDEIEIGDFSQLVLAGGYFEHTQIIVSIGEPRSLDTILVAAHSIDSDNRPLSTYQIRGIRFIHIDGVRFHT